MTDERERLREALDRIQQLHAADWRPDEAGGRGWVRLSAVERVLAAALAHDRPSGLQEASGGEPERYLAMVAEMEARDRPVEAEYLMWDGRRLLVTVSDEDPGDMGEPRSYEADGVSYLTVRAALSGSSDPEAVGLDVERLAEAMVACEKRRIEAFSPNLLKHIPGPDMDSWNEHAANVAAEYQRLNDAKPETPA